MTLRIIFDGNMDSLASADLEELAEALADAGVPVARATMAVSGVKDFFTIGVSIVSLTLSGISTLIAVVNFWNSQRKTRYSLKLDRGSNTRLLEALDASEISTILESEGSLILVIEKI